MTLILDIGYGQIELVSEDLFILLQIAASCEYRLSCKNSLFDFILIICYEC